MEKSLKLYTYIDGVSSPFPSEEAQIEILSFNYDAKRMGGAPTISATVMYPTCLDDVWVDEVYVEFNGEKYFLKQTPTSSKSNDDARYKHEVELVSERIALENVFFYDVVVDDVPTDDKPVSNSPTFTFSGNIKQFAARLRASLKYAGLDYTVAEPEIDSEDKLLSFDKVVIATALQESYNQFEIPYYFVGKTIYFDFYEHAIEDTFRYGADKELLSIVKTNANAKIINRCTGVGGEENIPYYYPNKHPQGELEVLYHEDGAEEGVSGVIRVVDDALFSKNILLTDNLVYSSYEETLIDGKKIEFYQSKDVNNYVDTVPNKGLLKNGSISDYNWFLAPTTKWMESEVETYSTSNLSNYALFDSGVEPLLFDNYNKAVAFRISVDEKYFIPTPATTAEVRAKEFKLTIRNTLLGASAKAYTRSDNEHSAVELEHNFVLLDSNIEEGNVWFTYKLLFYSSVFDVTYDKSIYIVLSIEGFGEESSHNCKPVFELEFNEPTIKYTWSKNDDRYVELADLGLSSTKTLTADNVGDKITFNQTSYVQPMPNLMPPIYWESNGAERFYNALNDTYTNPETGEYYTFPNPYKDNKRREHIAEFPDVKPTIKNVLNSEDLPINVFTEFAYDDEDNDIVDTETGEYLHPYFFGKLRKFDGDNGFNLFTHASEQGEMTFSMISGSCSACNFVLAVNDAGKNIVQVDDNGALIYEDGKVKLGTPQDRQNDTQNNEVWVALKKDTSTFGHIMPSAQKKYYPVKGDEFVITNIKYPIEYVKAAEKKLEEEIIKYMFENNESKFSFSIKFSRIYFEESPSILSQLNENSLIKVEYNGNEHTLYTSSFAYKMSANEPLPEITVELVETLTSSQNTLQAAISEVKTDVLDRMQKMDIAALVASKFLSKENEDTARAKVTFSKGLAVGTQDATNATIDEQGHFDMESAILRSYISSPVFRDGFTGEGFKLWIDESGISHLTVDVLTSRQKMMIYELLISKLRAVHGEIWVSAANGTIAEIVEHDTQYEIILEDDNAFIEGDYMRCQVFSAAEYRGYWVEISEVDGNRCFVNKSEFAGIFPLVGDEVILCGSKNEGRQNAIHISATEDGQPRISIYNGIDTKDFVGCLRTQLGNLDGIKDDVLNPQGDGLYSDNAYLKGEFVLKSSGESVETHFEITNEGVKSAVGTLQNDNEHGKTILYNPSFTMGENGWITSNVVTYYFLGDNLVYNNGQIVYNNPHDDAEPDYNNHRFILNVTDGYIKQLNEYFVNKPEIAYNSLVPIQFNLKMMVEDAGRLLVYIDGCDMEESKATAWEGESQSDYYKNDNVVVDLGNGKSYAFIGLEGIEIATGDRLAVIEGDTPVLINLTQKQQMNYAEWMEEQTGWGEALRSPIIFLANERFDTVSEEYICLEYASKWNGTGNFNLSFSGGASIYSLQLFTNATEVRYATLFEQTEKIINIAAQHFNDDGSIAAQSGIMVKPEGSDMYAYNGTTGKYAAIGVAGDDGEGNTVVKLTGDKIKLVGDLTVDGKFKVRDDGSIEARNALFSGFVQQGTMYINDENYTSFYEQVGAGSWRADITNLAPILIIEHANVPIGNIYLTMPSIDVITSVAGGYTRADLDYARGFIGSTIILYNYTTKNIYLEYVNEDGEGMAATDLLPVGDFIKMTCSLGWKSRNGKTGEYTYWSIDMQGTAINLPTE